MSSAPRGARLPRPGLGQLAGQDELAVTRYDNVAALLLALLVLVGATVLAMFVLWFTLRLFSPRVPVPVTLADVSGSVGEGLSEAGMSLDQPTAEELGAEVDLPEPLLAQSLAQLVDALATQPLDIDDPALTEALESGQGGSTGGEGRRPGSGAGEGGGGIPRAQRWEIYFQKGGTLNDYARQLDFFGIELGVLSGSDTITYVRRLAEKKPDTREGPAVDEKRLFMAWRQGDLREADRQLAERAGVGLEGRILVQFFPAEVEARLAELEQRFRNRDPKTIRKTRFGVRSSGRGYEFYVLDQLS